MKTENDREKGEDYYKNMLEIYTLLPPAPFKIRKTVKMNRKESDDESKSRSLSNNK